jgi:hypothetical protein
LSDNIVEVDVQGVVQPMRCVMCHSFEKSSSLQSSTKSQKGFITYNPKHGITSCKNMLKMNIFWICKNFFYTKILMLKVEMVVKDKNASKGHLPHLHPSPFFLEV